MSNNYQERAMKFARFSTNDYPFVALAEEAGEVMGKLAKFGRANHVTVDDAIACAASHSHEVPEALYDDLIKELGDVQWQLAACAKVLGVTLEEIQDANLAKLEGREKRGTLVGEGDER